MNHRLLATLVLSFCLTGCILSPADVSYTSPSPLDAQGSDMRLVHDMSLPAVDMVPGARDLSVAQDTSVPTAQDMRLPQRPDLSPAPDLGQEEDMTQGRDMAPQEDLSQEEDMAVPGPDMPPVRCIEGPGCDCTQVPCQANGQTDLNCMNNSCDVLCLGDCSPKNLGDGSVVTCAGVGATCTPECKGECTVKCERGACRPSCTTGNGECTLWCQSTAGICEFGECKVKGKTTSEECGSGRFVCGKNC